MTATAEARQRPLLVRLTPQMVALFVIAAAAAAWTLVRADGMWDMPGTMGYSFAGFIGMWTLMMAAMMLPSVAPFASMYARTVRENRFLRLGQFALGYMAVWALIGVPAYGLAWVADQYAGEDGATVLAVTVFAAAGIYQLTPLKNRCLSHCRSPLSHLLQFASYKGRVRDFRVGVEHGFFCSACCWGLMAVLVALGVMNVPAMVLLAGVIAIEKTWRWGEHFSRAVGVAALVAAVAVIWEPGLAPGLTNDPMEAHASMDGMAMDGEEGDGMAAEDEDMDGMATAEADSMDGMDMDKDDSMDDK